MSITMQDIAKIANVSRATVHRALHDHPEIKEDTKQRILAIAEELGYTPYAPARALAGKKGLVIPIVVPVDESEDSFWYHVKAGAYAISQELKGVRIRPQWVVSKSWDSHDQINIIRQLIRRKVDGIALAPIHPDLLTKVINQATEAGIPVVTFNTDAPKSKRMCFVGQDAMTAGKVAAELMGQYLGGEGKVFIITGFHTHLGHRERVSGFQEYTREYFPHIKMLGVHESCDKSERAYAITQKALTSYPNLRGIYVAGRGVSGAGQAVKDANRSSSVKVVSFDLRKETIDLIREGVVQLSILQAPFFQGYESVRILYNYLLLHHRPLQEFVFADLTVACRGNIEGLAKQHEKNLILGTGRFVEKLSVARRAE